MPRFGPYHTKPQDRRFVKEFVAHGNGTQAAMEAYQVNKKKNPTSAAAIANRKIKTPSIQEMIREEMQAQGISPGYILKGYKTIIDKGLKDIKDQVIAPKDINKSLDSLVRAMELGDKNRVDVVSQHLHLHQATRSEVIKKRQELNEYFTQIIQDTEPV